MEKRIYRVLLFFLFLLAASIDVSADDLEKDLRRDVEESKGIVARVSAQLQSGGAAPATGIAGLKASAERIRAAGILMDERFRLRGDRVAPLSAMAIERHSSMAEGYRKALQAYLALIDAIPPDGTITPADLGRLKTLLETLAPKKKRPLHGALPYRHLAYPVREPALSPIVVPAYKGGNRTVSSADTAACAEAPISAEITALAQSLQWNPVLIYEWVKNNVATEWYWGVMKGAEETLHQKSGNDADQAALLVSLLRASGFPTRFVKGSIEFFPGIDRVKNLTGIDDPLKIAAFFQKAGIPFKPVIAWGGIANFQVEHIWVETFIPYSNYRGAVLDDQGKSWLGLDTSIKTLDYQRSAPIAADFPLDTLRDDYLQALQPLTPLEYLKGKAEEQLAQNHPDKSWQDLLATATFPPHILKIIPSSLQFKTIAISGEYAELPAELRHQVKFTATSEGSGLFSLTLDAMRLSNRKVVLTYEPETVEDQQIIDSYGGLDNTPSYLVRLRPVITVDGERQVVAQDGLPMGADYTLAIDIVTPGGTETVASTQITGNLSIIGIVAQKAAAVAPIADGDYAEGILFKEATGYIDRWNKAEDELAAFYRVALSRPAPTVVTVGSQIDVTWLLGIPHDFTWKGVFIDAGYRRIETTGRSSEAETGFMRLSALQGSILENRIFEDDFQVDSVSTAKLLQLAKTNNTPILSIDRNNADAILPQLPFDAAVKEDITNAVGQGLTVTIPQAEVTYQDWSGIGYIKENRETGESGWMLSGQVAGGMTVWIPERWNTAADRNRSAVLRAPYTGKPNDNPLRPYSIIKIPATDLQIGTVGKQLKPKLQVKVVDAALKPVNKATVTFKILAGGGKLGNGAIEQTVTTDNRGIAEVSLTLGEQTSANPVYVGEGKAIADQYGGNVVDAKLDVGASVTPPFTAYGKPGPPDHLRKTNGDGKAGLIHSFAGFVGLLLEDSFGNPIANQPVTFTIADPVGAPACNKDNTPARLVNASDPCVSSSPTTANLICSVFPDDKRPANCINPTTPTDGLLVCKTAKSTITETSNTIVTAAEVILGGAPFASYKVTATTTATNSSGGALAPVDFTLSTLPSGNCSTDSPPAVTLVTTFVQPTDAAGRNIDAGRSGTTITLRAKEYLLREGERQVDEALSCSGTTSTCPKNVGSHTYSATTTFEASSIMFNGAPGIDKGNGVFELPYILSPGLNTIRIDGQAVYNKHENANSCGSCQITDKLETLTATAWLKVYGIDVSIKPSLKIMLDSANRSRNSLKIPYTIAPADYQAYTANILLYKVTKTDGTEVEQLVDYIPTENWWKGYGTLARGYPFDPTAEYRVQVVLNYGTGVQAASDKVPITFALGALVPDYNHNRTIEDDDDLDRALNDDIYYFWVNDDDDSGDVSTEAMPGSGIPSDIPEGSAGTDIPGSGNRVSDHATVGGTRDLVDWFPLHIDLGYLLSTYRAGSYTYKLKHEDGALDFVVTGLKSGNAGDYLTGSNNSVEPALSLANASTTAITADGITLSDYMLQDIINGKSVIIVEAWKATNNPLILEIYSGAERVFTAKLNLSIDSVEKMFRHKNLVEAGGGPAPFPTEQDRLTNPSNYPDSETNGKNFVFVHGYNVNAQQARGWNAEMFKRMYWSGSRARFWGVTWYGWDSQISVGSFHVTKNFHINVQHALKTASGFKDFINWAVTGDGSIATVAAHSLGNMLVSSAIADYGANVANYFLIDAAVPIEAYDASVGKPINLEEQDNSGNNMIHPEWSDYKTGLFASEWYRLFLFDDPVDERSKLTWRGRFSTINGKTNPYNYYSSGEEVLDIHTGVPIVPDIWTEGSGHYAWALQEKLKGRMPIGWMLGSNYGGWKINSSSYEVNTVFANQISLAQLKTKPFFNMLPDAAMLLVPGAIGSEYAKNNRDRLLAELIPALSQAAGRNEMSIFDDITPKANRNFDMHSNFKNGWPPSRSADDESLKWKHSDIREIGYTFVFKLFDSFISQGMLSE